MRRCYDYFSAPPPHLHPQPTRGAEGLLARAGLWPLLGLVAGLATGVQTLRQSLSRSWRIAPRQQQIAALHAAIGAGLQAVGEPLSATSPKSPPSDATLTLSLVLLHHARNRLQREHAALRATLLEERFNAASVALELCSLAFMALPLAHAGLGLAMGAALVAGLKHMRLATFAAHGALHLGYHAGRLGHLAHRLASLRGQGPAQRAKAEACVQACLYFFGQTLLWFAFSLGMAAVAGVNAAGFLGRRFGKVVLWVGAVGTSAMHAGASGFHGTPRGLAVAPPIVFAGERTRQVRLRALDDEAQILVALRRALMGCLHGVGQRYVAGWQANRLRTVPAIDGAITWWLDTQLRALNAGELARVQAAILTAQVALCRTRIAGSQRLVADCQTALLQVRVALRQALLPDAASYAARLALEGEQAQLVALERGLDEETGWLRQLEASQAKISPEPPPTCRTGYTSPLPRAGDHVMRHWALGDKMAPLTLQEAMRSPMALLVVEPLRRIDEARAWLTWDAALASEAVTSMQPGRQNSHGQPRPL